MARLLDGRAAAAALQETLTARVAACVARRGRPPGLAVVLVGENAASEIYVARKQQAAARLGLLSRVERLPATAPQAAVLAAVARLNEDAAVDAFLVQLPLPPHLDAAAVVQAIAPDKDADGLHPLNVGRLAAGLPGPRPCTPAGVMRLLAWGHVAVAGLHAVVLGRSAIVGRPMAAMLLAADATVTVCHVGTRGLAAHVAAAEVLVSAMGRPHAVPAAWIRPGAHVVDVGITRAGGRLLGDVDPDAAARAASITPVPGGVGPMTIAMLMHNCVAAAAAAAAAGAAATAPPLP